MYYEGDGVAKDDAEAVKWYLLAAAQGNSTAHYNLGILYGSAGRTERNLLLAYMWLNLAATSGNSDAVSKRNRAAALLSPQQVAEAQKLARECQARKFKGCE